MYIYVIYIFLSFFSHISLFSPSIHIHISFSPPSFFL